MSDMIISTWGYGGRQVDALQSLLATHPPLIIIDTRLKPFSKNRPCWNRAELAQLFGEQYFWRGEILGNGTMKEMRPPEGSLWARLVDERRLQTFMLGLKSWLEPRGFEPLFICCERAYQACHRAEVATVAQQYAWPAARIRHFN